MATPTAVPISTFWQSRTGAPNWHHGCGRCSTSAPSFRGGIRMASILVIDDDRLVRDTLSIMLSEAGHAVTTAKDGIEGVNKAERQAFDVAVIDIFMPEREGLETIRELRRRS